MHRVFSPIPSSDEAAIHIVNATASTFNNVGSDQYNITGITHIYPASASAAEPSRGSLSRNQVPFNDAPVDRLSTNFTGRKRELGLIAKAFERRSHIPRRCALFGNQGVGKSQLTYGWAKSTFDSGQNTYILWISATTVEKLCQGFGRLLCFVDHPDRSHPDQNVRLAAARRWFEEIDTGNWLLVLDNVFPETLDFLREHLPRQNGRGSILFTTRREHVAVALASTAGERHEVIEVPLLNVEEGVELFLGLFDYREIDGQPGEIEEIVTSVGCLPLAISHAAGYVKRSCGSLDELLDMYRGKHKIDLISWEHTLSEYEHKSVTATFMSQLQDLEQQYPDTSHFLDVLAFFDPDSISLEMLITGAKALLESPSTESPSSTTDSLFSLIQSPLRRQNAITQLQDQCLVSYHANSRIPTFRIHDLIQLVVLERTKSRGTYQKSFELAVELACTAFKQIDVRSHASDWWAQCEQLVPHVQSLSMRRDISDHAKKQLLLADHMRGLYMANRGRYHEAERLYEVILQDRNQLFDHEDLETLAVMHDLAWVYRQRGRFDDAESLYKSVLQVRRNLLGPEHRDTLETTHHLAAVHVAQQSYDDAEVLLNETLQMQEAGFGPEDFDTLATMRRLAVVYHKQDRFDEAETLLTAVLQVAQRALRPEHRSILVAKSDLASVYYSQRRDDAAASLYEQLLLAEEKQFGLHPNTLATISSLSNVYDSQGRYTEEEQLLAKGLEGDQKVFGLSHPYTQRTIQELASVYRKLGRFGDAETLEQRFS